MNANELAEVGDELATEERLRRVATLCVQSLMLRGLEPRTIRRTVLQIAGRAIKSLAIDEYEMETHTAVIQRTIDDLLSRASLSA
jgi:hypothetical protein